MTQIYDKTFVHKLKLGPENIRDLVQEGGL